MEKRQKKWLCWMIGGVQNVGAYAIAVSACECFFFFFFPCLIKRVPTLKVVFFLCVILGVLDEPGNRIL